MLFPQLQQGQLLPQRLRPVKIGAVKDLLYLAEREFQLSEQQDALQPGQGCIVIQPVSGRRDHGRPQQADRVVVVQRAHADTRNLADLTDCFHICLPLIPIIDYDAG